MNQGNYEDKNTYEVIKKTRLMINTFVEIRKELATGKIYYFSYGYLYPQYAGRISKEIYEEMTKDTKS